MVEVNVDWSDPSMTPGLRRAKVRSAEIKQSKKGELMLVLSFDVDGGGSVTDYLMLEGNGKPMGLARLKRLGITSAKFDTDELVGKSISLCLVAEDFNGMMSLKVDGKANATPFRLGYGDDCSASEPASKVPVDDGIPF